MRIALVADLHGNRPATLALSGTCPDATRPGAVSGRYCRKGPSNDFTF